MNRQIYETYMNSPLSKRDSLQGINFDPNDTWRKMVAYNADHTKDAKKVARLCGDKKAAVVETDFGEAELEQMSSEEAEEALWEVVQEISVDPEGLDPKYGSLVLCPPSNHTDRNSELCRMICELKLCNPLLATSAPEQSNHFRNHNKPS